MKKFPGIIAVNGDQFGAWSNNAIPAKLICDYQRLIRFPVLYT